MVQQLLPYRGTIFDYIKSFSLLKFYWLLLFERQMRKIHYSYAVLLFSSG